jgi:U3 small nucleolar RNA-associated protein 22
MTSLARAVMSIVRNGENDENGENGEKANNLFTPALSDFDIVIHTTNPSVRSFKSSYKNLEIQSSFPSHDEVVVKSTNVIDELYKDLSRKFQDSLILFYSSTNQHPYPSKTNVIGGIWYKEVSQPKKFKVYLGYSTRPTGHGDDDDAMVEVNKAAIIEEIKRLGGDLVSSVSCK